jgi:hypothetical protein
MLKNAQSTPFAKLKMILLKLDNFHEPFSHNKSGGLWLSATVFSANFPEAAPLQVIPPSKGLPSPLNRYIWRPELVLNISIISGVRFDMMQAGCGLKGVWNMLEATTVYAHFLFPAVRLSLTCRKRADASHGKKSSFKSQVHQCICYYYHKQNNI